MEKTSFREYMRQQWREYTSLNDYVDTKAADVNIRSNIPFKGNNIYILFVAIVIASVGLNVNSIPVIIGAMLISPLMGPIIGFGYGLGTNDTQLLVASLRNLGVMVLISLIASTLYFVLTPLEADNPTELLARTKPSIYDVLIAFFGGLAGMLEISRKDKGTVLSGVAIATALMPPLCTVGYGLANLNWQFAGGAMYLFFINSVFIALAAYIVTKYLRYPLVEEKNGQQNKRIWSYLMLILIVIVPSVFTGYSIIRENQFQKETRHFVKDHQAIGSTYIYDYTLDMKSKPYTIELRLAGENLTDEGREELYAAAEQYGLMRSQIIFRDEATIKVQRLNEKEILSDWIASTEREMRERDDSIRSLRGQLSAMQAEMDAQKLPTQQLTEELRSQWPTITEVTIARGDDRQILVILKAERRFHKDDIARIENWLPVRLQTDNVRLIIL
jgi:uncharacterized hydrophobic protein (TIGR00271 family)